MTVYASRDEAFISLRSDLPAELRRVVDADDGQTLLELIFHALSSEPLLMRTKADSGSAGRGKGYGAYIRQFGLIVNEKKAILVLAAFLTDLLLTSGLASLVLSQVIKDPIFVRRLTSQQHLMCILGHNSWTEMSFEQFAATLVESRCKNLGLSCKYQLSGGLCSLDPREFKEGITYLQTFIETR